MLKLLVGALIALTAANSVAGNMYIYKDKGGQVLLTSVNPSGNFDKFTKKVKVTYYVDKNSKGNNSNKKQAVSEVQNVSYSRSEYDESEYDESEYSKSAYTNSAYDALR